MGPDVELEIFRRAVRSVPGSGEVWARYIRLLVCTYSFQLTLSKFAQERVGTSELQTDGLETIAGIPIPFFCVRGFYLFMSVQMCTTGP